MDKLTRRAILRLGGAGTIGALAGCAGIFGKSADSETPTLSPAPLPEEDPESPMVAAVGEVVDLGDVSMVVERVERLQQADIFGFEVRSQPGKELLALSGSFKNTSDRYVVLRIDQFEVAVGGGIARPIEPFVERVSPDRGGWPFAPGEVRPVMLHYHVPAGTRTAQLHGKMRVRTLPDDPSGVVSVLTDLTSKTAAPALLDQSLSGPIHAVGEPVEATGLTVHVGNVTAPVEVPNLTPATGAEFLAVNLSVTNDGTLLYPVVIGVGGNGGLIVADDEGNEFTDTVWFDGRIAGGRYYDSSVALTSGETNEGTVVDEVPVDATPLYLLWTPPVAGWEIGSGVAVNRFIWQVR